MEAPEKLYYGFNEQAHLEAYCPQKTKLCQIEYTRTDAFIEKATKWLKENAANFVSKDNEGEPYLYRIGLADEFIKAMML